MGSCLPEEIEKKAFAHFRVMPDEAKTYIGHHIRNCLQSVQCLIYDAEQGGPVNPRAVSIAKKGLEHLLEDLDKITNQEDFETNLKAKLDEMRKGAGCE